ncbi:ead/Ea22-like family protein [Escherichia coli]|nr:ead/Ea22-like family protein [Escherichia coli]
MSNIDKQALRLTAEKAKDNFMPNFMVPTRDVLALLDELEAAEKRIAELEAKLDSADKLQDSAFRHGLQHGFSLGQTDNQAGFEECLSAYGTGKGE